jgi:hypothetical protein
VFSVRSSGMRRKCAGSRRFLPYIFLLGMCLITQPDRSISKDVIFLIFYYYSITSCSIAFHFESIAIFISRNVFDKLSLFVHKYTRSYIYVYIFFLSLFIRSHSAFVFSFVYLMSFLHRQHDLL